MQEVAIQDVVFDPKVYPRKKWNTSTIDRYADALMAGAEFPPIVLQSETNVLLDGKHRLEAHKKRVEAYAKWQARSDEEKKPWEGSIPDGMISAQYHTVPKGMTVKYYAATQSSQHGDRLSNADLKVLAEEEFEADSKLDPTEWGKALGVSKSTVYYWVSHILERERADRASKAWRLAQLGWTVREVGEALGIGKSTAQDLSENSSLGKIGQTLGESWNDKGVAETATRLNLPLTDAYAAAMVDMSDEERMKRLDINIKPYDVWTFSDCHDLMGNKHPGRIPGQLVAHVLYFYTKQGDLVIDPMVGSGTTLDACLLMGRKCRGYDIDDRHERVDVEQHDLGEGWPEPTSKSQLVFWDPPYYSKMDSENIGGDGYIEGSISKLSPDEYLDWLGSRFGALHSTLKAGARIAFLMSDWDSQGDANHGNHDGIFIWDYAKRLQDAGFKLTRQIQCPLSTQQIHPDIVNKFRASRRLARLERYLIIGEKK